MFNRMQKFRPLQKKLMQAMGPQLRTMQKQKSGLLLPQPQANFGGMMGMGDLADALAGKCDPNDAIQLWEMEDRVGILLTLEDSPGILNRALNVLHKNEINMTSIQSRPPKTSATKEALINFNIDFHGSFEDENVMKAMEELE